MAESNVTVIKKYGNRRLYDTDTSTYINLEDLSLLLKKGREIQVVDAKTQQDLTRPVLLQLILERERQNVEGLPVELLKELIVIGDTPARRWFDLSMKVSLEMLRRLKKSGLAGTTGWTIPWLGIDLQEMLASMIGSEKRPKGDVVPPPEVDDGEEADSAAQAPAMASVPRHAHKRSNADTATTATGDAKSDVHSQLEELKKRLLSLEASLKGDSNE